jgi:hypothetical protein
LTILRIAELAIDAGLPAGALNVLTGGGQVGKGLSSTQAPTKYRSPVLCRLALPAAAAPWAPG